jgi:hypothetical protein
MFRIVGEDIRTHGTAAVFLSTLKIFLTIRMGVSTGDIVLIDLHNQT